MKAERHHSTRPEGLTGLGLHEGRRLFPLLALGISAFLLLPQRSGQPPSLPGWSSVLSSFHSHTSVPSPALQERLHSSGPPQPLGLTQPLDPPQPFSFQSPGPLDSSLASRPSLGVFIPALPYQMSLPLASQVPLNSLPPLLQMIYSPHGPDPARQNSRMEHLISVNVIKCIFYLR